MTEEKNSFKEWIIIIFGLYALASLLSWGVLQLIEENSWDMEPLEVLAGMIVLPWYWLFYQWDERPLTVFLIGMVIWGLFMYEEDKKEINKD